MTITCFKSQAGLFPLSLEHLFKRNKMKTQSILVLLLALICSLAFTSCDNMDIDEPIIGNEDSQFYSLGVVLGNDYTNYMLSTDDITSGSISPVGNGVELSGAEYIQSDNYIYFFSRADKKFYQYELHFDGSVTETAALLVTPYITDRAYSQNLVDENTLLIMDPVQWGAPEIKWFTISLPDFIIKDHGTFVLPTIEKIDGVNWNSNLGRGALHGDKFIMGTVYYDFDGNYASGTHAIVLDYPEMSNPNLISTDMTDTELGVFTNNNFASTSNGDLYLIGYRGAYGKPSGDEVHGVIFRIKAGETDFDGSYLLDLTKELGETTQIMQLDYLEGEFAMGMLFNDTGITYENLDSDHYYFSRINLPNKTIQVIDMPRADIRLARKPWIGDGKYISFIKSAENKTTKVLQINYQEEPITYETGIDIAGENIQGYSVVKHPSP
tara:strand:- start:110851 stop:112167 length:1317 start_codon:yes stop_codon:yes gene_type:complete